jgi:predicted flap endonuclease-1-like 5' DNA nuclease
VPSTFGQWLIVVLALALGWLAGWVLRGRRGTPSAGSPIVDGAPVAGVGAVPAPAAEAVVDAERPAATVVPTTPPAAVVDRPTPETAEPTRPGAVLADSDPAAFTTDDAPADGTAGARDAEADTAPAKDAEPVADAEPVVKDAEPVVKDAEPVAEDDAPADAIQATTDAAPAAAPAAVPAPRTPADDSVPSAASTTTEADTATGTPEAATVAEEPPAAPAPATEEAPAAEDVPAVEPAPQAEAVPVAAEAVPATDGPADDFRRVQGIGPKMAAALHDAGIRTYRQLADLDEATLRETIRAAGLRAAASLPTWPQQAKVLAGAGAEADRALPATSGDAPA